MHSTNWYHSRDSCPAVIFDPKQYTLRYDNTCYSRFMGIDFRNEEGLSTWILGDAFLRAYYSINDFKNARVGLAKIIP